VGRNSRLRKVFVKDPPSEAIAVALQAAGATACEHKRNPCLLRCGVRCAVEDMGRREWREGDTVFSEPQYRFIGPWEVIPTSERYRWLVTVERLIRRDRRRHGPHKHGRRLTAREKRRLVTKMVQRGRRLWARAMARGEIREAHLSGEGGGIFGSVCTTDSNYPDPEVDGG
jgi:hypothetical protein